MKNECAALSPHSWSKIMSLAQNDDIQIERVRLTKSGLTISGSFPLPPLARLSVDDLVFIGSFIKCHGSIKEMERLFGVSYPTIKNRLNCIAKNFDFLDICVSSSAPDAASDALDKLNNGEISVDEAIKTIKGTD